MRIFLIGYMGSGKSTLGMQLAELTSYTFIDMDKYIEDKEGKSIVEIFKNPGESHFRNLEKNAIQDFNQMNNIIVATGGGAPCFFDNMEQMNNNGLTIYLNPPVDELVKRLKPAKAHRPIIKDKTDEELKEFIISMLEKRNPFYLKATYQITHFNPTAKEILSQLKEFN